MIIVAPHTRCVDWNTIFPQYSHLNLRSHLTRGAWIEMWRNSVTLGTRLSHLTRGAWIEIHFSAQIHVPRLVAPHTRCVDWNICPAFLYVKSDCRTSHEVRGLKCFLEIMIYLLHLSHLTRGAWIEIIEKKEAVPAEKVAPHTRCVDWNNTLSFRSFCLFPSHLTRGAWIEIRMAWAFCLKNSGRTSHEVRGLKYWSTVKMPPGINVAPHTRCVDWNSKTLQNWKALISRTSHEVRGLK